MEELYRLIEEKIKASGYPGEINGEEFFADVCDETDDKEPGFYIFMITKNETLSYTGAVHILEDQIDLHTVDIREGEQVWHVDFDA